jgi:PAS domain S-box-containing protein
MPRSRSLDSMAVTGSAGRATLGRLFDDPAFAATLVELSQALVCVLDRDGRIVAFNRASEDATGYSASEVLGRDAREMLVPPEQVEEFDGILARAFEHGESSPVHGTWLTKDRRLRVVDFSNRPLRDETGTVRYFVATGLDVTERERATGQLVRLASEQAALRRVATLVARAPAPEEVFQAVAKEAGLLLGAAQASAIRFDGDIGVTVGRWSAGATRGFEVGATVPLTDPDALSALVARTGLPARVDDYSALDSPVAQQMQRLGYRSAVAAPIVVHGHTWGLLMVASAEPEPLGTDAEERLVDFSELVALALESAQAHADLAASRARIVNAGDAVRRRLERNLHDGAQQRLVGLALQLRIAQGCIHDDSDVAEELIAAVVAELQLAIEEVREIARGLHPAVLSQRGIGPALESLAARAPFSVELTDAVAARLPEPVEAALYYVVAESLTNAAKHASPTVVTVNVGSDAETAWAEIDDDGAGGAKPGPDGGIQGLADRVATLGGRFIVSSPAGGGTHVRAELPLRKTGVSHLASLVEAQQR